VPFKLVSSYKPTGDQPQAVKKLTTNIKSGLSDQVLLGVTGSGKTFTVANVIQNIGKPTLVISHNKTLAAQLYQEFRDFFPNNAVEYFVSYYDYYQPESYLPATDTYIEKDSAVNDEIDRLRLKATAALMTRNDVIVVSSVSCIYSLGSPAEYNKAVLDLKTKVTGTTNIGFKGSSQEDGRRKTEDRFQKTDDGGVSRESVLSKLIDMYYVRNDLELKRANFRVRGENIEVWPAYENYVLRLTFLGEVLTSIKKLHPITFQTLGDATHFLLYPAKHYVADPETFNQALTQIELDLGEQLKNLEKQGKQLEAYRLKQRTQYDLEMLREVGFVNGIENYSRYFDGRRIGEPPYTLLDFFAQHFGSRGSKDWLLVVDESHISIPQVQGMYNGDRSRKKTLIDFGFRLPSALDNRPLNFDEFLERVPQTIYMSATPSQWELERSVKASKELLVGAERALPSRTIDEDGGLRTENRFQKTEDRNENYPIVEQLIRPTGLVDPQIKVLPASGQILDLRKRIEERVNRHERVLVTTLTKKMAEELAGYLEESDIKVTYLHSDIETLERTNILDDLRRGNYDVLVGINLLREGLDLPEVSLVAILDADKEGFLRSDTSLIQVMGRAARHVQGEVVMYADRITDSMRRAIDEVERRRAKQITYNQKHGITPQSIQKVIRSKLVEFEEVAEGKVKNGKRIDIGRLLGRESLVDLSDVPPSERQKLVKELEHKMRDAAEELNFELAAQIRDEIVDLRKNLTLST